MAIEEPPDNDDYPRLRVRDLAKRFESINTKPTPKKPTKRVGKFRIISGNHEPVRVGIARKKSSLRRRSISYTDIRNKASSSRRSSSTAVSRAGSKESLSPSVQFRLTVAPEQATVVPEARNRSSGPEQNNHKDSKPQSRTPPKPSPRVKMSVSERPPTHSKPAPPAKPARLMSPKCSSNKDQPSEVGKVSGFCHGKKDQKDKDVPVKEIVYQEKTAVQLTVKNSPVRPFVPPPPPQPPSKDRIQRRSTLLATSTLPRLRRSESTSSDTVYQVLDDTLEDSPTYLRMSDYVPKPPSNPPPPLPDSLLEHRMSRVPTLGLPPIPPSSDSDSGSIHLRSEGSSTPRVPHLGPPPVPPSSEGVSSRRLSDRPPSALPAPPSLEGTSQDGIVVEEDFYEEIGTTSGLHPPSAKCPSSSDSSTSDYVTSVYCGGDTETCVMSPSCMCTNCTARRRFTQWDLQSTQSNYKHHYNKGTHASTLGRKCKRSSAMEIEKVFKFKSDLHLNITKKMEKLREKVVGDKTRRAHSKFSLNSRDLNTDVDGHLHEDEQFIYGDDWSSDEELRREEQTKDDAQFGSTLYQELEEEINKVFPEHSMSNSENHSDPSSTASASLTQTSANSSKIPHQNQSSPDSNPCNLYTVDDSESATEQLTTRIAALELEQNPCDDDLLCASERSQSYTSRLPEPQPLYQIYMLEEQEKIMEESVAGIECAQVEIPQIKAVEKATEPCRRVSSASSDSGRGADCSTSTSALTSSTSLRRDRLIAISHFGSQRSLWCELPEVKSAGLLEQLDEDTRQLQEAYFEVVTSEASYLRSLNVLITHFMADPSMLGSKSSASVISNDDRKHLFSNIFAVRDCSERLLCDLESRLEESLVLDDICDILTAHFEKNFEAYVKYCSNQVYQDRTLRRLKNQSSAFMTAVGRLESDKQCQGLDMRSFLMLPMQRITRYPLLIYAIVERVPMGSEKQQLAAYSLQLANQVVSNCNEGARKMERTEQLLEVDKRLVYKENDLKRVALVSANRYLVKRGSMVELLERRTKGILQSRSKAQSLYLFLFSDMLLVTKRKMNGTYVCKDYADRRYVDTSPVEPENPKVPLGVLQSLSAKPHLFLCVLMKNARGRQTELLLNAESESDRERWLSAIRPPASANPEEKVYADWDCPQAIAVHAYEKGQDDELELTVGETINILRKMPDGWFYGERRRDGVGGWFPSSYVQLIINDHTRAKHYRQRLRLIQAASDLRAHQMAAARAGATIRTPAIINKLRRMSNPRNIFQPAL